MWLFSILKKKNPHVTNLEMNNYIDFLARYIHSVEKVLFKKNMLTEFDHILGTRGKRNEFLKTNLKKTRTASLTLPTTSLVVYL